MFLNSLSVSCQLCLTCHYPYRAHSFQRCTTRELHESRYFVRIWSTQYLHRHSILNVCFSRIFTDVLRSFGRTFQQTHTQECLVFHDCRRGHVSLRNYLLQSKDTRILARFCFPLFHLLHPQWLRRCATSRKVPGSIPGRVTGDFFRDIRQVHVSGVDSAFRNEYQDIPGGKGGRCVGLTTLPPSYAECIEIW
jgi:hypothetical protein